jgi:hypothetical protein
MVAECPVGGYLKLWEIRMERINVVAQITAEELTVIFAVLLVIGVVLGGGNAALKVYAGLTLKIVQSLGAEVGLNVPTLAVYPNAVNAIYLRQLGKLWNKEIIGISAIRTVGAGRVASVGSEGVILGVLGGVVDIVYARIVHIKCNVLLACDTTPQRKRILRKLGKRVSYL